MYIVILLEILYNKIMTEVEALIDYINKIKKLIQYNADFSFLNKRYIQKDKIDTLLICALGKLPQSFKKKMRVSNNKYNSINAFSLFQKRITVKAWFAPSMYAIDYAEALKLMDIIVRNIKRDIVNLENEH